MKQQRLGHGAERTNGDLLRRHTGQLQLPPGGGTDIEAMATGLRIGEQRTTGLQLRQIPTTRQGLGQLPGHGCLHLIVGAAHGGAEGNQQISTATAGALQLTDRLQQDPSSHATPAGMAGGHAAACGVGQQHRCAIRTADPQALTTRIAHQSIGLGPGFGGGGTGGENAGAVHLLRPMHAHPGTHGARQFIRAAALPLAGEEPVFEGPQQIRLQVIAAVATHPGPAHKVVEAGIGAIKRRIDGLSHGNRARGANDRVAQASGRSRRIQNPSKPGCSSRLCTAMN